MKTAEEWMKSDWYDYTDPEAEGMIHGSDEAISFLRRVQLDALREGMRRAAEIARPNVQKYKNFYEPWLGLHNFNLAHSIYDAILSASEDLTIEKL